MPILLFLLAATLGAQPRKLTILPSNPLLFGQGAKQQLVVLAESADGRTHDVTSEAALSIAGPAATIDKSQITAQANGASTVTARFQGIATTTTALVQQAGQPAQQSFASDILPVLTKYGCNGGSCHGALNGQNGFKLSLFGYEPEADHEMIVAKHNGRRIDKANPEKSLLLAKPTYAVKHAGGKLFTESSTDYQTLKNWIQKGAPSNPLTDRQMVALRVIPELATLTGKDAKRRLLVTARFNDGTEADVSNLVKYSSNDDSIAAINLKGEVTGARGGETAVVVRGPGVTAAARVAVIPNPQKTALLRVSNFVDEHINTKLQRLSIAPSELADDATFLRRVSLDIIGLIPTGEEARAFLQSTNPNKRAELVDSLLKRPEYADYWALYWGDHLDNTKQLLYNKGPYSFTRWLNSQFESNIPYDQFVRNLLTSSGNMYDHPATNYYPLMKKELDLAEKTSQLFLGVSIGCARCHNHPLERWKQDDFNGLAAYFSQVRYKNGGPRNNERTLYVDFDRQYQNPDSKRRFLPKPLDGPNMDTSGLTDRRELLAFWVTAKENPWFARAMVNRMWRNFMGRGFVEPVDDFRITNPPTNEPLLNALAKDFTDHNFDLHHLIRRITASSAYQLSSVPNQSNKQDTMAYSRYYPKRLGAEPLLDSLSQAAGSHEPFQSMYPGTRATQLPEPEIESYFLEVFDRPSRQLVCERKNTPTLNQALHMIGGDTAHRKASDKSGFIARNLSTIADDSKMAEELYLRTLSRFPDAEEKANAVNAVRAAKSRQQGLEDVLWALMNTKEFLYNH